jgi:hypothetical protein
MRRFPEGSCDFLEPNDGMEWSGRFEGTLSFGQLFEGSSKSKEVDVEVTFDTHMLPRAQLLALGYGGEEWHAYASGSDPLSLSPLYEQQGTGTAWAYNASEADGSANELTFSASCATIGPQSIVWQYDVTYALTDLVDYATYGYANPDAPITTMSATESYTIESNDQLVVDARSTGMVDGDAVSFSMRGLLTRIE